MSLYEGLDEHYEELRPLLVSLRQLNQAGLAAASNAVYGLTLCKAFRNSDANADRHRRGYYFNDLPGNAGQYLTLYVQDSEDRRPEPANTTIPQWTADVVGMMHLYQITEKQLAYELHWHEKYLSVVLNGKRTPKNAETAIRSALDRLIQNNDSTV